MSDSSSRPDQLHEFWRRPLGSIADEVLQLRETIRILTQENRETIQVLTQENHEAQDRNATLNKANKTLQRRNALLVERAIRLSGKVTNLRSTLDIRRPPPRPNPLPYEVLRIAFAFIQLPPYRYDPSIIIGPRNPWLEAVRTNKSLALVCKAWSHPATEFLYETVIVRRMGQVFALSNTLRMDRTGWLLARLVKSIRIDSCFVPTPCRDVFRADLALILDRCTKLRSFSFCPHPNFSPSEWSTAHITPTPTIPLDDGLNPVMVLESAPDGLCDSLAKRLASGLRRLQLGVTSNAPQGHFLPSIALMLSHATYLTWLTLDRISGDRSTFSQLPALRLSVLETLQLDVGCAFFHDYVCTRWEVPKLTALMCLQCDTEAAAELLKVHGSGLTFWHFCNYSANVAFGDSKLYTDVLPRLFELCPRVEHIVLPLPGSRFALPINSPTLRYLDIICEPSIYMACRSKVLAPHAHVPSLKTIRQVETDIGPPYPLLCHPSLLDEAVPDFADVPLHREESVLWKERTSGGIVHDFPQRRLRQQSWCLTVDPQALGMKAPVDWADSGVNVEDEDSDGDYALDSDDDTDGSFVSESTSRSGSVISEDFPEAIADPIDGEQYDRTTVLQMFSDSQVGDFVLQGSDEEDVEDGLGR